MIRLLFLFLWGVILFLAYMRWETKFLELIKINLIPYPHGVKVIQLSDIHIGRMFVSWKKIAMTLQQERPDIILLTGDFVEHSKQVPELLEFLKLIGAGPNVYACYGNHDLKLKRKNKSAFDNMEDEMRKLGITILQNQAVEFHKNGKTFLLAGFDDCQNGKPTFEHIKDARTKPYAAILGITHNPDLIFSLPKNGVDYLFCGHFHGGQIWMPFDLEYKLLRKEKSCKMGMKKGLHQFDDVLLYINRGLGNVLFPFRLLSRPEITVFHL